VSTIMPETPTRHASVRRATSLPLVATGTRDTARRRRTNHVIAPHHTRDRCGIPRHARTSAIPSGPHTGDRHPVIAAAPCGMPARSPATWAPYCAAHSCRGLARLRERCVIAAACCGMLGRPLRVRTPGDLSGNETIANRPPIREFRAAHRPSSPSHCVLPFLCVLRALCGSIPSPPPSPRPSPRPPRCRRFHPLSLLSFLSLCPLRSLWFVPPPSL
jgi:hypothetical protein